jgi:hypothetical protein
MLPPEYRGVYSNIEELAPTHLLPYHDGVVHSGQRPKEVMPLTN